MGKALNDYYQSYYKHPLNGYDSRYFDLPLKSVVIVSVTIVIISFVRTVSVIVLV